MKTAAATKRTASSLHEPRRLATAARARRLGAAEPGTEGGGVRPGLLALVASGLVLLGCGGGGGGGGGGNEPPPAPKPPTAQAGSVSLDVLGTSASSVSGKVAASDPQGLALTYTVTSTPSAGTVSVDSRSGNFTYTVAGHATSAQDSFTVAVSNGQTAAVNAVVTVQLKSDPLTANQWHIRNTGASAFSTVLPAAGNDMNVAGAWAAGYSGKGVKVAVVDSGLEVAHEDLAANIDVANSFNFLTSGNDPTPAASVAGSDHGTQVAGIIGAVAFNGKGGRGVAYSARLRGYNVIAPGAFSALRYGESMGGKPMSADNAVFNTSFGDRAAVLDAPTQALINVDNDLGALRGGLGAVLVKSAGNTFVDLADPQAEPQACSTANSYGVSCGHPSQDSRIGAPTPIVVGAINADGKRASYSTTGSSLWVSAPGGEFGFDSTYYDMSKRADPANSVKPGIVTTARGGCTNRFPADGVANDLVTGNHRQALNCQYTATMNGTSSAAPNVAGVVALMLEANPKLGARDVKFILAKTAKQVDRSLASVTATDFVDGATITLEQGWVRNAAGFLFSNSYGFGAVDASAAVEMARTYMSYLPASKLSASYNTTPRAGWTVPPDSAAGQAFNAAVRESFTTVERVIVTAHFDETPSVTCNQIEVVSPAGTKSILLHAGNGYTQESLPGAKFLSNAFYGEPVNGTWKFTVFNFCTGRTLLSATKPQSIQFYGR